MTRVITAQRIDQMLQRASQGDADVSVDADISALTSEALSRKQLKTLDLSGLEATALDALALKGFSSLRKLNLSGNSLEQLPEGVFGTRKSCKEYAPLVSWLNLAKNDLVWKGLKPLAPLEHLVTLNLSDNRLNKFPKVLSRRLIKLKALVLSRNKIQSFELVHDMSSLNSLVLSQNTISILTEDTLRHMPRLAKLSLSNNCLREIPNVKVCPLLAELRMAHNELQAIEMELAGMEKLKLLDLGHNRLDSLGSIASLKPLTGLSNLNLAGNPALLKDGEPLEFAVVAKQVVGILKEGCLRILNSKPLEKFGINTPGKGTNERFERAQWKRKKNLISTKLPQPDATKPRNKPCPCGSRKKFKLCCELKHKEKNEQFDKATKTEKDKAKESENVTMKTHLAHGGSTTRVESKPATVKSKNGDANKTKSPAALPKPGPTANRKRLVETDMKKASKKQKKESKSSKQTKKEEATDEVKVKRKQPTATNDERTPPEDVQSKVLRVTSFSKAKEKKNVVTAGSLATAVRRANEPSFEAW